MGYLKIGKITFPPLLCYSKRLSKKIEFKKRKNIMSEILEKAVAAINDKMAEATFDSSVKFKIEDAGSIVVDSDGVRVSDEETDCTLIASLDVFTKILDGDMNATEAYMTGSLKVEGSMSAAMELSSLLA